MDTKEDKKFKITYSPLVWPNESTPMATYVYHPSVGA